MSEIVLFHSGLGVRPGVHWFADRLRAAGHTVHNPDLYDGEVFDSLYGGGLAKRDALGDIDDARELAAEVGGELYLYPPPPTSSPTRTCPSTTRTELIIERTLAFLVSGGG